MQPRVMSNGASSIARALAESGVRYFFYVSGGMGSAFYKELEKKTRMILCRNEMATCLMANGYSMITKEPSACYSQHGAAASILASVFYEPMASHSPVIALTGSVPTNRKHRWYYQDCDEMPYFQSTSKFNVDVTDLNTLPQYIRIAVQIAVSGCPGPVHVNIHNDMVETITETTEIQRDKTFRKVPLVRPRAEKDQITKAAKLLLSAERPIMVCGSGVHISEAYDQVRQLSELLTIPVASNYRGKGCFPEKHPLWVGVVGSYGMEYVNEIVRESDLVFFIGTRAEPHMTEELTAPEPGASRIIHLDIDPLVMNRNYDADVPLVGDAKSTLEGLIAHINKLIGSHAARNSRVREIARAIEQYEKTIRPMIDSDAVPIKPQRLVNEISKVLKRGDVIVSDSGHMLCWTLRLLKLKETGRTYIPCAGTLGSSFPIAIGVSFGLSREHKVLNLIGDGGISYNLAELETAKRYNDQHAPIITVVNNNSSLAQPRPRLEDWTQRKTPWIRHCDFGEVNFAKAAEAFGCYGVRVERPNELAEAIRKAHDSRKPAIVDVVTDKREYAPIGLVRKTATEVFPGVPPY
jgi:acetolactate synthase-1/2/3 large subunit